ncbi:hypothetical protein HNP46_002208 [Pseudomonas nitritireducens]|uniref:Phage tail protein n=1 Tax=Pseudomonas nitroreducens TaxID=46680 RepID=A0A7W7P0C3_PSENT|nr:hypothetical protein [Pseudomonas nitritireducens]MBB4863361.1 hypothetical protein [Pseudomonas nitritireducens]
MYQIDIPSAAGTQPASTSSGTAGYFTDGNPATGIAATIVPAEFLNAIMMELLNTITAAGITPSKSQFSQLTASIKALSQAGVAVFGTDTGAANVYVVAYTPAIGSLVDGMVLKFKAKTANTGASTFNPNGTGAKPIVGLAHAALQGGEIAANGDVWVQWNSSIAGGSWVLVASSGGAMQCTPATRSQHAVQFSQLPGVVGTARNLKAYLSAAAASGTFTADEVILESALGGLAYRLPSFSKTINLATTGAGGMDTGTAPVNGFVAIYAIYNPTTRASALLGVNATSITAPEVYGGANMPAGYTASSLVSVWPTNASSQFLAASQSGRKVGFMFRNVLSTSTAVASLTSLSIAGVVPRNALAIGGMLGIGSSGASALNFFIAADIVGCGYQMSSINSASTGANPFIRCNFNLSLAAAQKMFWGANGAPNSINIDISSYEF